MEGKISRRQLRSLAQQKTIRRVLHDESVPKCADLIQSVSSPWLKKVSADEWNFCLRHLVARAVDGTHCGVARLVV